jgi:MoxR-like ATPase
MNLIFLNSKDRGKVISLKESGTRIGRAEENDIEVDDIEVSSHHAVVEKSDGQWRVYDLNSTNGTWVGKTRVRGISNVKSGDGVRVGETIMLFTDKAELPKTEAKPGARVASETLADVDAEEIASLDDDDDDDDDEEDFEAKLEAEIAAAEREAKVDIAKASAIKKAKDAAKRKVAEDKTVKGKPAKAKTAAVKVETPTAKPAKSAAKPAKAARKAPAGKKTPPGSPAVTDDKPTVAEPAPRPAKSAKPFVMPKGAFLLRCPACERRYEVQDLEAGRHVRCSCNKIIEVGADTVITGKDRAVKRWTPEALRNAGKEKSVSIAAANPRYIPKEPVKAVEAMAVARERMLEEIGKIIVGQKEIIDQVLTAFFARGHCLLMGVPGLAKTLLVNTLSETMKLDFNRIQFTPDLMPTDITGTNILEEDPGTGRRIFKFAKGPIFSNILLADEINRTPPKTQAALLEAMQEKQISSGQNIYNLPRPFLVLATQNPIEQEGTYTLPEAQLDRFIFMVKFDYPTQDEELEILLSTTRDKNEIIEPILNANAILEFQNLVRNVPITEHVAKYANRLVRATRPGSSEAPDFVTRWLRFGCGPRAGQALLMAAKSHAVLNGRFDVACEDIRRYALPTLRHRVALNFAAASEGHDADHIISKLLETVSESG